MRDRVAEILAERASLQRGAGAGFAVSVALHGGLLALLIWSATHATAPVPAPMVQIQFTPAAGRQPAAARATPPRPVEAKPAPEVAEPPPVPQIEEPKPVVETPAVVPEKNTVPLSPFGRSTKKGSETPAPAKPRPAATPPGVPSPTGPGAAGTTAEVPVGGSGVTGLEGGDFPYTLYIGAMHRRIGANWFRPQIAAGTTTIIYFRILRNGTISEARVETSSGNPTFDRAALSAVRSSTPLNPLPPGYSGNYLGVHLTFR